jgi:osmotically-inducible protein OsmY
MKTLKSWMFLLAVVAVGTMVGCSATSTKSADVSNSIRTSLDQAGFKDVTVSQDRDKGVVTLGGHVATDADKSQAESVAKSLAGAQVVANQIAVVTPGAESATKDMNSDLDKGIESNLDAALINAKLHNNVKYSVKNHVVTLTGEVHSEANRTRAEQVAAGVPNALTA